MNVTSDHLISYHVISYVREITISSNVLRQYGLINGMVET